MTEHETPTSEPLVTKATMKKAYNGGRGFAAMDPDKRREIARKGGASVPNEKRSFTRNTKLAAAAGRKGGMASRGPVRTNPIDTQT